MPTLTVRQLDEQTYAGLKDRAQSSGRSMEAEAREILASSVNARAWGRRWIEATEALRGDDLPIPPRSVPREAPLP